MVRNITGTLLAIAKGHKPVDVIPHLFEVKDRRQVAEAAPPHGLFLMHVMYDKV